MELINKTYGHKSWQWKRQNSFRSRDLISNDFCVSVAFFDAAQTSDQRLFVSVESIIKMPKLPSDVFAGAFGTKPFLAFLGSLRTFECSHRGQFHEKNDEWTNFLQFSRRHVCVTVCRLKTWCILGCQGMQVLFTLISQNSA